MKKLKEFAVPIGLVVLFGVWTILRMIDPEPQHITPPAPTASVDKPEDCICVGADRQMELLYERAKQWHLAEQQCRWRGGDVCAVALFAKGAVTETTQRIMWNEECTNQLPGILCAEGAGSCDGTGLCAFD